MIIKGKWFAKGCAQAHTAVLSIEKNQGIIKSGNSEPIIYNLLNSTISSRIGNIPRKIVFHDGSVFITNNNDAIDSIQQNSGIVSKIERKKILVFLFIVIFLLSGYGLIFHITPIISARIVNILPSEVIAKVSQASFRFIDESWAVSTNLSDKKQAEILQRFENLIPMNTEFNYQLYFRNMGMANAFALPDGKIIITDELIKLIEHPHEIDAVILHEIGHVELKHGLHQLVHDSLLSMLAVFMLSDIYAVGDLLIASPLLLLQTNYSREQELEADAYVETIFRTNGISVEYLVSILERLHQQDSHINDFQYISTHPTLEQRLKSLR